MRLLKNRSIGFYLCLVLLLTLAIGGSAIVYADSSPVTVPVKAGSLTEANPTNQVSVNFNGTIRLVTYTLPITVIDARGSAGGWNLMVTSTKFKLTNGQDKDHDKDIDKLPSHASYITGVNESCDVNSTCTSPINSISYPLLLPAGNPPPPPVKFFNATVGSGLGKILLTMMVQVKIPAPKATGTYTSTVILTIVNGP